MRFTVALLGFLASLAVQAAPVTWTLQNVVLDDGATAGGYFIYDTNTDTVLRASISTTSTAATDPDIITGSVSNSYSSYIVGGPNGTGYNPQANVDLYWGTQTDELYVAEDGRDIALTLRFAEVLTNQGGVVDIIFGREDRFHPNYTNRFVVSGQISAVPVPAAVWLFVSALAGLGWLRRKQSI